MTVITTAIAACGDDDHVECGEVPKKSLPGSELCCQEIYRGVSIGIINEMLPFKVGKHVLPLFKRTPDK